MAIRWQFVEKPSSRGTSWTWHVVLADGETGAVSPAFPTYGAAVLDAIRHGFLPTQHDWSTSSGAGIVRFHYGDNPVIVPRTGGYPARTERKGPARRKAVSSASGRRPVPKRPASAKRQPTK